MKLWISGYGYGYINYYPRKKNVSQILAFSFSFIKAKFYKSKLSSMKAKNE